MTRCSDFARRLARGLLDCWLLLLLASSGLSADWPTYRADGARSGYTAEAVPEGLTLEWFHRASHRPSPAWSDRHWQRMAFDFAYQPVVAGDTLYYGGSVDCMIHALDAATGRHRWSFPTDGPVRFAPAVWRDRVLAVSDDGYLYGLASGDGKLLWKARGGPSPRKILGNGRMISSFPARGGLVVHDDVAYFGAGIFPTQGFFLHALDPQTGRTLWTNDTSGNTRLYQYNHGFCYSNVAGQGYLAVAGEALLVSTGRSIPAAYRRRDGEFLYFHPLEVYRTGGAWMMAADGYVFNGDMAFHVADGAVACPELGVAPGEGPPSSLSPFLRPTTMIEGAVTPELILIANGKEVRAIDRKTPFVDSREVLEKFCTSRTAAFFAGSPRRRLSQNLQGADLRWTALVECPGAFIVAGNRAYAGARNAVRALDLNTRKVVWTGKVEGTVYGLAAADGRLYASSDEGLIYCFGSAGGKPSMIRPRIDEQPYPDNDLYDEAAEEILRNTRVTEGYCLDLGCGEGRLAYALAKRSRLQVYAVDGDADAVASARRALAGAGLYGARVTVHQLDPADTGFPVMRRGNFVSDLFTRLAVHRASDGRRLWSRDVQYHLRPLVIGRTVVADPGGFDWTTGKKFILTDVPCAWDLLTGEPVTRRNPVSGAQQPWTFGRTEKCSGWTGSPNLLLYRTGTISYYDFLRDEGRSDVGGTRPSCFINVFAAGGLVLAPDNSSGCTCNYLHRTSIALQPLAQKEHWALFMGDRPQPGVIERLALNLGAVGDRRAPDGTLWLALPRPSMGISTANRVDARAFLFGPESVSIQFAGPAGEEVERMARLRPTERPPSSWPGGYSDVYRPSSLYHVNTEAAGITGTDLPWVYSSANRGPAKITVNVSKMPEDSRYRIRLHFAEIEDVGPGQRVFDVSLNRQTVLEDFDVAREAGSPKVAVVRELESTAAEGLLTIALTAKHGEPILSGLEVVVDKEKLSQRRQGAKR